MVVRNSLKLALGRIPLHVLFTFLFVTQIFGVGTLIGYLSYKNGQKTVNELAQQLLKKTSAQIEQRLSNYLEIPILLANKNARNIQNGALSFERSRQLERYLWEQIQLYPSIYSSYISNRRGQFVEVLQKTPNQYTLYAVEQAPNGTDYPLNERGERGAVSERDTYDPRERPWYQQALKTGKTNWSPIYLFSDRQLGMTASAPISDRDRNFQGVTGVDITLTQLDKFLKTIEVSPRGQISILEPSGSLIATSTDAEVMALNSAKNNERPRGAMNAKDPLTRAIAQQIAKRYSQFSQLTTAQQLNFIFNGERHYVQVMPYRNSSNLNWLIVTVVPENDFMRQIKDNRQLTIILCLFSLALATGVGILTARWLITPLARFVEATELLANGELDNTVEEGYIREIKILARSFNWMTCRLQAAFFKLEMANAELEERVRERTKDLEGEREKSERLLLNILPEPIAQRLKNDRSSIAEQYENVTLLFADIVGFTPLSARLKPIELVNLLNEMFSVFDTLAEHYGLEKIKTIGDAYMVAGGLPIPNDDSVEAIAQMALDMLSAVQSFNLKWNENFQVRIGVNTGAVVAGVIGTKKFIYDVWGDTVNVASRMESSGSPGMIQVTEAVREKLKERFMFEERGTIEVKGKGEMKTYWLRDRIFPFQNPDSSLADLDSDLENNSSSTFDLTESTSGDTRVPDSEDV